MIRWALLVIVVVVGLVVQYAPVYDAGFIYEDHHAFSTTHGAQPLPSPWSTGAPPVVRLSPKFLTQATFYLQQDSSSSVLRLTNVGLHLGVGVLLLILLRRLGATGMAAALGTVLFLLNPVAIESVAYITGRSELLAALGILITCLAVTSPVGSFFVPIGLTIALLGKHSGAVVMALAPLVYAAHTRWREWVWPFLFTAPVVAMSIFYADALAYGDQIHWARWAMLQATAAYRLTFVSVWPLFNQTVDYDYVVVPLVFQASCLLSLGVLAFVAWQLTKVSVLMPLGIFTILIVSLPRLIVQTPFSLLNEHQWYSALLGFAAFMAGLWDWYYAPINVEGGSTCAADS